MEKLFKSVMEQDRAAIVLCNPEHVILYMNRAAVKNYEKRGGEKLIGQNLLACHNEHSREMIEKVVNWFAEDASHNMIYTSKDVKRNKDVYMVALRDEDGRLIGYYEKHEFRNPETAELYDFSRSLV